MRIEFRKYGARPVASTPIWASFQAFRQGSKVVSAGRDSMLPPWISANGLTEFTIMMNSGRR